MMRGRLWGAWLNIKGSQRDPLFYFGCTAAMFLLVLAFGAGLFFQKGKGIELGTFSETQAGSLFVGGEKSKPSPPQSFLLMGGFAIRASLPPVLIGGSRSMAVFTVAGEFSETESGPREGIVEYTVQKGDTSASVAEKFGISLETVLWANNLSRNSALKVGQRLVILPIDGVLHHVKKGDTISEIAKTYQGDAGKIIAFNNLTDAGDIYVGDILIVPGGKMPKAAPKTISQPPQLDDVTPPSYFMYPLLSPAKLTQGLHWYNAVDFDAECGDPIVAAASGVVLKVARTNSTSRWALRGAGNHLTILHPNGTVSYYGHVQDFLVKPGDQVLKGQRIAIVGGRPGMPGAGLSTGCHLHFGVTGAKNPFAR